MKPYNILFVQHDSGMSGSTISLRNMLSALDRSMYSPRVALFTDGPAKAVFESLGIPVDIIPARRFGTCPGPSWKELGYYINWLALFPSKAWIKYLKENKFAILHINDKACLQVGISSGFTDIPVVWHLRSSYFSSRSKYQARVSRNIIKKYATSLIAISEDEVDGFEDCLNLQIIHNSADFIQAKEAQNKRDQIRLEFGIGEDEIAVATLSSTINEVRGTWDFIRAAGIVQKTLPAKKVKFFIVARIPPKETEKSRGRKKHIHPLDQANSLIQEYGLEGKLKFTGYRSDPLVVMAGMDILVVCNRHGVLGRMPFEAMSVGTPVVATAGHSGKSKVVIDGETGLVVNAADPKSIADGVMKLILDTRLRNKIIRQGHYHALMNFDPQKNARLVENIYKQLLGKRGTQVNP